VPEIKDMKLASPWTPRLAASGDTPADRLAAALAQDIAAGALEPGARLPAHRELAERLEIGLGSVTKAFAALERRGLVESVKGRGCFVAAREASRGEAIDLAFNAPPALVSDVGLKSALVRLARRVDPALLGRYPPLGGHPAHRAAMGQWLGALGGPDAPERTLLCDGAQQALALALTTLRRPGEALVTEAPTYPGLIALARTSGLRLIGARMDAEGVTPEGLETAMARAGGRPVVFLQPTGHNPTGATMGLERRRALVALARLTDALIVEDDVFTHSHSHARPALATLAPERVFYVNSLSKTVSPGLRVGALVAPPLWLDATLTNLRATSQNAGALGSLVMQEWIETGAAARLREAICAELTSRQALAATILGEAATRPALPLPHIWAPMPLARAQAVAALAAASGVAVTPPDAVAVDQAGESGLRICLGAVDRATLETGLATLRRCLDQAPPAASSFRPAL
jgi:DNA-binding transcriptional MocR family regulator